MRRTVEKLSWLVLSLTLGSVVSFAALARLTDVATGQRSHVPLLVNLEPRNARDLALAAAFAVARGEPDAGRGAAELERLGGAALPHVLGSLDALDPVARARVSVALVPVARRMGLAEVDSLQTPEQALVFWTRFWQDRSADFRATVVRRKVARLAERALALRQKEVLELDTFAIPELIDALGRVRGPSDVERVERIAPLLRHATGVDYQLPANRTVNDAAALAARWRRWARENGMDYTTLDGPGRLTAVVTETRYFRWLEALLDAQRHGDELVQSRTLVVLGEAARSLAFAVLALVSGLAVGCFIAKRAVARARLKVTVAWVTLAVASVPLAFLATRVADLGRGPVVAVLSLAVAAFVAHDAASEPMPAHYRAVLWRACVHTAPLLSAVVASLLAAEAVARNGFGARIRLALEIGDVDSLMMAALAIAVAGLVASTVSAGAAVYRPASEGADVLALPNRARVLVALAPATALGLFAGLGPLLNESTRPLSSGLRSLLLLIVVATAVALFVALTLGLLAGLAARSADVLLARAYEVTSMLPTALVAAAILTFGGALAAILLGTLRGIEVAFLFRTRLAEGRQALDLEPISLGRTPLLPQLSRLLPAAVRKPLSTLFLTGAWIVSLEIAAVSLGARPSPIPTFGPAGSFVALSVAAVGAALFALLSSEPDDTDGAGLPVLALNRRRDSSPSAV
jgi:hypothetical protein